MVHILAFGFQEDRHITHLSKKPGVQSGEKWLLHRELWDKSLRIVYACLYCCQKGYFGRLRDKVLETFHCGRVLVKAEANRFRKSCCSVYFMFNIFLALK